MKLLILTQKVDQNDPILGFFHRWVEEFAKHYEQVSVICLGKGEYHLPSNVKVYSLGKEEGKSVFKYLFRFYKYIWSLRHEYDAVFVHMNQEYVILGWKTWFLFRKPIYLWRNHALGSWLTRLAILLSKKVFYTSPASYTARFKKSVQMPVGIDTEFFKPDPNVSRILNSVLFLGRISPVKKVAEFIEWLKTTTYHATLAGPIGDKEYSDKILNNLPANAKYIGPVTQAEALKLYQTHEIYVNKTPAGSFDKTIFEAAASGMRLMVDNQDAQNIQVSKHSLKLLMERLKEEMA
jgi:glycosyltransferase involved in cell wall biosynthesis